MIEPSRAEFKYLIERQREEIKTITEVGRLLSTTTDPQEVIRLVSSYLRQTFPLALCAVLVIPQRKLHVVRFAKIAQMDFDVALREIWAKAQDRLRRELDEHEFTRTIEDASAGQGSQAPIGYLRSNYSTPLVFDGQILGLLTAFSGKAEAFTKEDEHVIDIVADQLRAALRNAILLDELRQANQLKNELLMVISHELRIPLTSIQEGVNLVLDGSLGEINADQKDFLSTVTENTTRLEKLVEKVMIASQLVSGGLVCAIKEVELDQIIKDLVGAFQPAAQAKSARVELRGADRPLACQADPKRIKQAVGEVLENAVQAVGADGRVEVSCTETDDYAELVISDTGPGIPAEELPKLFGQFRFVGGVDDRKTGGLGLGLFIAKGLLDLHKGTIQLDSQSGQGTTVRIAIPKKTAT
ncbi:MAG: GAF domain-containing sensor histidine kinase [Candidatus Omnitrophica bacterium]|nr:GAF domain-containing sensor histidine kinase [Candidatus Omnitrophota bacterium]